jgi:class 3 adenylate cyclase
MHRKLKNLLHAARGESQFVVSVFLDVRGFSSWMTDSSQSAVYLKSIYTRILDDYFPTASFFKPTGDGLLIVLDHDEQTLQQTVQTAVARSVSLVGDFAALTDGDLMVNFAVPQRLGIGIARGSATRLVSGRQTLDYSGHPLNLAARLMDLARPSGVVFDGTLKLELLDEKLAGNFREENVYVKGIADETPITVYALKGQVEIPEFNRYPIGRFRQYASSIEKVTLKQLTIRESYLHPLDEEPSDRATIKLFVRFPKVLSNGRKSPTMLTTWDFPATFVERRGSQFARADYRSVAKRLTTVGVRPNWNGEVWLEYSIRDGN